MRSALVGSFYFRFAVVQIHMERARNEVRAGNGGADAEASFQTEIDESLTHFEQNLERLELRESGKFIAFVRHRLVVDKSNANVASVLRSLIAVVENEGKDRYVFHFTVAKARLYSEEKPKWEQVSAAFKETQKDIDGAINCHAFGEETACVFHCMRIAELGLRALARERRIKIAKKPLEWADWNDILTHIKAKVEKLAQNKRGPARDAALEFYRGALGEFEAFKDVYRNNVMHVRKSYDVHQAASVLFHVREFMVRLAEKINDDMKKQILWGLKA